MKPLRERMGRLDPNDPHPFAPQTIDSDAVGGRAVPSRACAVCDASKDDPRHGAPQKPIHEQHGPFGQ